MSMNVQADRGVAMEGEALPCRWRLERRLPVRAADRNDGSGAVESPTQRADAGPAEMRIEVTVMHYLRIYADEQGETHFEDVTLPTRRRKSPASSSLEELTDELPVDSVYFRRVVVDHPPEPHSAPCRQFVIHLAGEAELEVSDGEVRRVGPGMVVLADDVTGKGHQTRQVGDTIRETLMIPLNLDLKKS